MPTRPAADIRNIVLVGPGGSGKTSLVERLLFSTGSTKRLGTVLEGNTVSDYTDEEKSHKHSLHTTLVHFDYEGHLVNVIDTPGLADFIGHAIACFPAAETVAVVIDPNKGIDSITRRMMKVAEDRKIPRMLIVNKIDEVQDGMLEDIVSQLQKAFGPICLPINLPSLKGKKVVNVFEHDGNDSAGNQADFSSVKEAHKAIVEQVIELDEDLTMQYLEKGEGFDPQKLHAAFEKALEDAHLVPICFVSAKTGVGADDLLHIFASLCPSPLEVNPPEFQMRQADGTEQEWHSKPGDANAKLLAHIFKVATDPFLGKLGYFRVHQGTVKAKAEVLIDDHKKPVKLGHLFLLQGKEHVEVSEVGPGAIGAIAKIDEIKFNGVIHDSHELDSVHLLPLPLPKPMYGLAIELKNHADETKFSAATHKLMAEDPCFIVERIAATNQTIMRGLGELHLRIIIERFKHQYGIELITTTPKVAYKETITARAEGHHRHKKQTGGAGQFGEVYLRVVPLPADHPEGFEFENATVGGSIPRNFIPAIEKGVRQVLQEGAVAGYPLTGVRVEVYDGKYHDVDSKEIAFITAGRKAFIDAVQKAKPVLMEPFVALEITAPSRYMGDLAGQISTKRGRVQSTDMLSSDVCVVRAEAPLSELQNYSNELKSMTGGAGSFTMDYSHSERTPPQIQAAVVAAYKPKADAE
ncbi:MAG TPA: elongation factor G [Phycisphaerales bacterium]|nr:elongation factor G [Phycisphaerales bacterium]